MSIGRSLILAVLALATLAIFMVSCGSPDETLSPRPDNALRVATHNVHYIMLNEPSGRWSRGDWEARKPALDAAFKALDADLVAFQEMESFARGSDGSVNLAREWLLERNPGYEAAAMGDWREFPSTQPILYRADRLEMQDQGWFFFSDTPDVIYSRTFNGSYPAFASWAAFRRLSDGATFRAVNVHFEFKSRSNRRLSAELVARRIAPWIEAGENVILLGDLNARDGGQPLEILERVGFDFLPVEGSTYHFDRGIDLFGAIDHIALSNGVTARRAPMVLRRKFEGRWPSDHYPVVADLSLD